MRSTIICVDDEKMILNILSDQLEEWLGDNYLIEKALSGEEALEILNDCISDNKDVSCVISDYIMPVMKGDELLEKVKNIDSRIKKIMLTGYSSIDGIISAINRAGLYRYITKPWDSRDLMLTLVEAIRAYEHEKETSRISKSFERLYKEYERLYHDFEGKYNGSIEVIVKAVEIKEPALVGVSEGVSQYAEMVASRLNNRKIDVKALKVAAMLCNIGKLVMNADGKDTKFRQKQQIIYSEKMMSHMPDAEKLLNGVKYQFEYFDGSGVLNIEGESIPIEARIISASVYLNQLKNAQLKLSSDEIIAKLTETRNTMFDPEIIDTFIDLIKANKI